MTAVLSLVMTVAVFADDISNGLDTSVDATAEIMSLSVGGGSADTQLRVITANGDGKNGCNLTGSTTLVVAVTSSDTAVATVTPSSITFGACGDTPTLTVSPASAGTATISLSQTSNSTDGTFNLAPATFTVNVSPASDPCASVATPAAPVFDVDGGDNDGNNGWFINVPLVSATSSTAGATISYSVNGGSFASTAPVLGEGTTLVTARATSATCNKTSDTSTTFMVDTFAPIVTPGDITNTTWRNTNLSQAFSASDAPSGLADPANDASFTLTASAESADASTPTVVSRDVYDNAGNWTTRSVSALIDKSNPVVALVGGPTDGGSYYFGSVPSEPTCQASDALSGLSAACSVYGYSSGVGMHTVTASATDNAGNTSSDSRTYTVLAWTLRGFYSPVDMNNVFNVVKGGSSVPLKFNVFAGSTELTSTSVVVSFVQTKVNCDATAPSDEIEVTSTGGTSLRYDATGGQFIQNWQTPKQAGQCYRVTMTTQDGSSLTAFFKLK